MRRQLFSWGRLAGAATFFAASPALSAMPSATNRLGEILACRTVTTDKARLACFDAAAGNLSEAQQKNDIMIVDREQVREAKRNLFGFSLPNMAVFGDKSEPLATLEATLISAQPTGDGAMTFVLDNGSRWHQQDDVTIGFRLKTGAKVVVRRGALNAYRLSVDNHPGVRVTRVN